MNCPECRIHSTKMGESVSATLYRCPKGHSFGVPKMAVRMKVGEVEMASSGSPRVVSDAVDLFMDLVAPGTPPGTARDRPSYKDPKPFGPTSLPGLVLTFLRYAPHRIDHHEAERRWGHTRLAGTIHILRTHGYKFQTHMNEGKCAVYELLNPQHRHTP